MIIAKPLALTVADWYMEASTCEVWFKWQTIIQVDAIFEYGDLVSKINKFNIVLVQNDIYRSVINDVIAQVKESFLDESIDIDVLNQLKKVYLWIFYIFSKGGDGK